VSTNWIPLAERDRNEWYFERDPIPNDPNTPIAIRVSAVAGSDKLQRMHITLKDEVAVVTGGSRGIGAATVKVLVAAGAKVVFNYHRGNRAAKEVIESCKGLDDAAVCRFGKLDILVANAGIWNYNPLPIEEVTEKQWDEMMAVNLKGVYSLVHHVVPQMIRQKRGRIIVVSSTAGQRGEAFHTHYGASKGGLLSFVKGLSTELARHCILVNCVAPGWVETDMSTPVLNNRREYKKVMSVIPLRRFARPEEIALPILFLASSMATFITGEILNVNGGSVLCG
jgi:3-oxoacyl-[acyl-carrier protein] reductase